MEQIRFAVESDIPHIMSLMSGAAGVGTPDDWYVTDDEDFVRRHLGGEMQVQDFQTHNVSEGYTLKCMVDGELAAFLIVRHPGEAEDNLGLELLHTPTEKVQKWQQELLHRIAHMESAAVHPAHRGKGLQGKLLAKAEEIEVSRGTGYLMATVHPDNIYSLRNLEAAGYRCIRETEKYGGLRRKVMCKEL